MGQNHFVVLMKSA